ncbi:LPO_1073/Vpar_1526 family protein [Vreelandella titanicae]|uniref:LPO_1073/Vpar_1526 family protein n=1 Tax=Vreelandella titanicae TaxID=664683 RepID=UPI0039BF4EC7
MLDNDTQSQKVSDGSFAVQSGRDSYVGMQYSDVKDLVNVLLENNFPRLRAEAVEESKKYVDDFGEKLIKKMASNFKGDDFSFLSRPSFQASVNDGVMYVARKTNEADLDLVSDLILDKINNKNDSIVDIVSSEAISMLPRINKNIIAFLSFNHYLRFLRVVPTIYREVRTSFYYGVNLGCVLSLKEIEPIDKDYVQYLGLCMSGKHYVKKQYEIMSENAGVKYPEKDYKEKLQPGNFYYDNFLGMSLCMRKFGIDSLNDFDNLPLSNVAHKIASSYLKVNGVDIKERLKLY